MTKEFALARITKAQETIEKKQKTIEKKQKTIEKKIDKLSKLGFTYTQNTRVYVNELVEQGFSTEQAYDIYWLQCDIEHLEEDIERGRKEIAEKESRLPEYQKALDEAEQRERILAHDIPESLKMAREELVEAWTRYDVKLRDVMRKAYAELSYKEFHKLYSYSTYESLNKSEEELRKINEKEADMWIIDLYNRVKDITGDITDSSKLHWGGKSLNGLITGKNGVAEVFTIEAGGYNIQRWHLRVLVKAR